MALVESGETDEGIRALEAALEAAPDHPMTLFFLGEAHLARGDRAAARRAWERLIEAAPNLPIARSVRERLADL
jgi:cytochrome c-type biogenesis protein CcmH/NrfG